MGGNITVNSIYTQGTTFILEIPQEIAGEAEVGELNLERRHNTVQRKQYRQSFEAPDARILVVDDNSANLLVVTKLLRATKVQVDTAISGEEALTKTLEYAYPLIFMDHMMPGMNGIECLHRIREQMGGLSKEARVVALTANAGSENRALYAKEGFDGYLLKPVSGAQLEECLIENLPRDILKLDNMDFIEEQREETQKTTHTRRLSLIITTESVCDLPRDMLESREIPIIPYHVKTSHGDFFDGIEAEGRGLLSFMTGGHKSARSEHPTVEEYENFFAAQLVKANHIIHIAMSSKVGKGYSNACAAAETFENVTVVDSGHLSSGMGLFVLEAARLARNGVPENEILKELSVIKAKVHTSFIVDDTEYLARAGRLSEKVNRIAKSFFLHPALILKKGKMSAGRIYLGSRERVWHRYIIDSLSVAGQIDPKRAFVTYVGLTSQELAEIEEKIRERSNFEEIIFQKASSAVSANCGPGTFGILFMSA